MRILLLLVLLFAACSDDDYGRDLGNTDAAATSDGFDAGVGG